MSDVTTRHRVRPEQLAVECDPAVFGAETTAELAPLTGGIIGQDRAVKAMEFGLTVSHSGYNLYVMGPAGTGRTTYAETKVHEVAAKKPTPDDWIYVYNFRQPDRPTALRFPAGQGERFRHDLKDLVEDLKRELPRAFERKEYTAQRKQALQTYEEEARAAWQAVETDARTKGFALQRTPSGVLTIPIGEDGEPYNKEQFLTLSEEERETFQARGQELQEQVSEALRKVQALDKEARNAVRQLERETGLFAVEFFIDKMKERWGADQIGEEPAAETAGWLDDLREDVVENLETFRSDDAEEEATHPLALLALAGRERAFQRYEANLFIHHAGTDGAPVIFETNPTYYNLVGKMEYKGEFGALTTDHTQLKPGALHRANGGYLVLPALELLQQPNSWQALKRALRSGCIRIESLGDQVGLVATAGLRPEPITLQVKVLLIGNSRIYQLLYHLDEDFRKLFKIKVDFDSQMERTEAHLRDYAAFITAYAKKEGLLPFDAGALAAVVAFSSRLAEHQQKLSTHFHDVTELLVESSTWAKLAGRRTVGREDVRKAVAEKIYRNNRVEERLEELLKEGTLLVDTEGEKVGTVNGLSVLDLGDYRFGKPGRITARTSLGAKGVVHIERETKMSGPSHTKGVYILAAYLGAKYAQVRPLALSASLTFEQTYEEVDGDSASSTELYALLSELSGLPLAQNLAVTGSVNQHGEVQPIGGVNEKIEGFFRLCQIRGLTGDQGVIIPQRNLPNLMLAEEVRQAVRNGQFHIYAVNDVDEGIELLTGVEAGQPAEPDGKAAEIGEEPVAAGEEASAAAEEPSADRRYGGYPPKSVNGRVAARLWEMAENLRRFAQTPTDDEGA